MMFEGRRKTGNTSPLPQISRNAFVQRACERGSVCKRLPQDFPQTSPLELVLQSGLGSPAIGGLGLNKNLKNRILQVPLKNWGKC